MAISEKLVALFLIALGVLLFLGLLLFRSTRASPEQRFGFIAAVFVQLIGTIAFGAVVSYSLFTIQRDSAATWTSPQRTKSVSSADRPSYDGECGRAIKCRCETS
jgi:hypothetical protein